MALAHEAGPSDPPVLDMTVGDLLRRAVEMAPDRTAVVEGVPGSRRRWTYAELLEDAERCARALLARYRPGDHVAIWAPNVPEFTIFQCGAALAGMVMVTINPTFRESELRFCLAQSEAVACFSLHEFRGKDMKSVLDGLVGDLPGLREAVYFDEWAPFLGSAPSGTELPDVDPGCAAQIQYTSGTTGVAKGAVISHRGLVNDPRQAAVRAGGREGDVWLAVSPMFHVGGCVLAGMGCMSLAGTLVLLRDFHAGIALQLIEEERVTISNPVPTMVAAIMRHPSFVTRDLSSWRSLISGGAPVPAEMVRHIEGVLGVDFTVVFGQTETSGVITMTTVDDSLEDKAETSGRPLPGVEIKIVSPDDGSTRERGEVGELLTRGYHTMLGYNNDPAGTEAALEPDGWAHTGDLCVMDERGYIKVVGRIKEMIIRGGENIYPREIEDALFTHPDIETVAVVGLPDDYYGEIAAAFVKLAPGSSTTGDELSTYLRPSMSGYKIPSEWYFIDEFPQTASGKIQKFRLQRDVEGSASRPT